MDPEDVARAYRHRTTEELRAAWSAEAKNAALNTAGGGGACADGGSPRPLQLVLEDLLAERAERMFRHEMDVWPR